MFTNGSYGGSVIMSDTFDKRCSPADMTFLSGNCSGLIVRQKGIALSSNVLASNALVSCFRMSCISDCTASLEAVTSLTLASRLAVRFSSMDIVLDRPGSYGISDYLPMGVVIALPSAWPA